ncbi:hypothetical protein PPL_12125 [Heterostelium album PN500]|uniref:Right handed beta helix domain-containing protein n=1 Tax=Heterostelium pallidum (strain ATCC 26659 / Pp 5 / PN500) TaxID=670386 RepID=D3BLS1_HETP5|nr:hypothetical protein PPL_12125 [Heterostelium album PN500]EFA77522.1 hypothetical protein PPL_12125 [Heterostelium album PN500]|eukprot:XP_020429650.1 hypothetical protein PPL_12125 [Heterostelium album PN500]
MNKTSNFICITDSLDLYNAVYSNVTLQYLNFKEGQSTYGGVVSINMTLPAPVSLNLIGVTAISNLAAYGGVVGIVAAYTTDTVITLKDSTFKLNYASYGSAFYSVFDSSLVISNCIFESNNAQSYGTIYTIYANVSMDTVSFITNTAQDSIVYIKKAPTLVYLNAITFTGNFHYSNQYGLISIYDSSAIIYNSNFKSNQQGSAIQISTSLGSLEIHNSTFDSNVNANNGGALLISGGASVRIYGSVFTNNFAINNGGAIYNSGGYTFIIQNCNFTGNSVTNNTSGGAVYIYSLGGNASIENSTFNSNSNSPIYCSDSTIYMDNLNTTSQEILTCSHPYECTLTGNSSIGLCHDTSSHEEPHHSSGNSDIGKYVGIAFGCVGGIVLVAILIIVIRRRNRNRYQQF